MPADRRPNVLVILTDQQRFDTIAALTDNFQINTPGMDSLAARGVSFDNTYCTSPVCGPSRSTIMTGLYPTQAGIHANLGNPCSPLRGDMITVGDRMQAQGYQTVYHGKWHLGGDPSEYGFEVADECSHDATTVQLASRFYRDRDWLNHKRPFFHVVSLLNPHDVYFLQPGQTRDPQLPRWANQDDDLSTKPWPQQLLAKDEWTDERLEYYRRFYGEKIERVDRLIVELLDELTCGGFAPNTFVIFTSDHGDMAGEHGLGFKGPIMYEGVTRVPMIVCPPQHGMLGSSRCDPQWADFQPRRVDGLASLIDLVPTVLDIAGAPADPNLAGQSLLPAVQGKPFDGHETVISEWHQYGQARTPIRMARDKQFKYTHYIGIGEELYDLEADPHELTNLADSPDHAAPRDRLRQCIQNHCDRIADPFHTLTPSDRPAHIQPVSSGASG